MVILVDTGNTHNFLDPRIVRNSHLCIRSLKKKMQVKVADGDRMLSEGKCENVALIV
jgi:hypothetical protein